MDNPCNERLGNLELESGWVMIDDSPKGSWCAAMLNRQSLKFMTLEQLRAPDILDRVMMSHGFETMAQARDLVGKEINERAGK